MSAAGIEENTAVSVFSGAGGLDLGLELAGWNIAAQVEMDHDCVGTLTSHAKRRRTGTRVVHSRLEDVDPRELRRELGLQRGKLGLLAGGPPCQPFTTTGLRKAMRDQRAETAFPTWLKWVQEFEPRAFVMENVDGLLSCALRHRPLELRGKGCPPLAPEEQKGSFLQWLVSRLVSQGYTVSWGVIEAADYGVPQYRQRALLIGVKGDGPCYLPPRQYGGDGQPAHRTLRHAIGRLRQIGPIQPLSEFKTSVFACVPPGGNWRNLPEHLQKETMGAAFRATGGKNGWWRRLSWDAPSPTILGMPDHSSTGLIHPDEVRCLSVNECRAIQTFPSTYTFFGRPRSQYQQIGNAVPVKLGRAIGIHLGEFLAGVSHSAPEPPAWRPESANRRIGTHGWATGGERDSGLQYELIVKVREDHVWAKNDQKCFDFAC